MKAIIIAFIIAAVIITGVMFCLCAANSDFEEWEENEDEQEQHR